VINQLALRSLVALRIINGGTEKINLHLKSIVDLKVEMKNLLDGFMRDQKPR
jgi:hypothetical protein